MNILENYLITNNYADNEKSASKIIEAVSDEFLEYILQEITQSSYDRLQTRLSRATTPERRATIRQQIIDAENKQRKDILEPKTKRRTRRGSPRKSIVKSVIPKPIDKKIGNIKKFISRTVLGGLVPF